MGIQVNPSNESRFTLLPGINKPTLLVLAKAGLGFVPTYPNSGTASLQLTNMVADPQNALRFKCSVSASGHQKSIRTSTPRTTALSSTSSAVP